MKTNHCKDDRHDLYFDGVNWLCTKKNCELCATDEYVMELFKQYPKVYLR